MKKVITGILGIIFLSVLSNVARAAETVPVMTEPSVPGNKGFVSARPAPSGYVPGELVVKLKEGMSLQDIEELNSKYNVTSSESVFSGGASPHDALEKLKQQLAKLEGEHDSWYWQLDKNSKEYKDYVEKIEREKESLKQRIKEQETFVARIDERQKRAPEDAQKPQLEGTYVLKTDSATDINAMVQDYAANPAVEYAEPNYTVKVNMVPNDPYYTTSGAWGQSYYNLWGLRKIQMESAWNLSQGKGAIVAVIDTGIDFTHEDIAANIWTNSREIPGNNFDDDYNGYVDDIRGWNFVSSNNDPKDGYGHGTHCAGTIAAVGNNSKGIIGVAPQAKVMAVKGLSDTGFGSDTELAKCIYYAANNGADVLSNSWGGSGKSSLIADAMKYAFSRGCVIVAAAGNDGGDVAFSYPANLDNVIAVAATGQNDKKCSFSNWGDGIEVAAPGGDDASVDSGNVLSLLAPNSYLAKNYSSYIIGGKYLRLAGTSMACPHVAGVAALLTYKYPNDLNTMIRARIVSGADPLLQDSYYVQGKLGVGRVNAYRSLTVSPKPYFKIKKIILKEVSGDGDQIPEAGESVSVYVQLQNIGAVATSTVGRLSTGSTYISSILKNISTFGTINSSQVADNASNPFVFKIGNMDFEKEVKFTLTTYTSTAAQDIPIAVYLGSKRVATVATFFDTTADVDYYDLNMFHLNYDKIVYNRIGYKIIYAPYTRPWPVAVRSDVFLAEVKTGRISNITPVPSTKVEYYNPHMYGDNIVWIRSNDIYLYNALYRNEMQKITATDGSYRTWPRIYKNKVVWHESLGGVSSIWLYDIATKQKKKIASSFNSGVSSYAQYYPEIYENKVVWTVSWVNYSPSYTYGFYYEVYDIVTGQKTSFGQANALYQPVHINGNKVVWIGENSLGTFSVYTYDLDTRQEKMTRAFAGQTPYIYNDKVVFMQYTSFYGPSTWHIYVYDLNKDTITQVSTYPWQQGLPQISGYTIAWVDLRDSSTSLYVSDIQSPNPEVISLSPSSGSSVFTQPVSFTSVYADSHGFKDIGNSYFLVNSALSGARCFFGYYNRNTNRLYMMNDSGTAWLGGYAPGSPYTIENSYAKIDCSQTCVYGFGSNLTVNWKVTFKMPFLGQKNTYLYVSDNKGRASGWVRKGTWNIVVIPR